MDAAQPVSTDTVDVEASSEPLSTVDGVVQIQRLLESFASRCDDEMLKLKDEYLRYRPRLSWYTLGLACTVMLITTLISSVMLSTGAATGHLLLASLGQVFLYGLVIASGLTDLMWRDPGQLLSAKDDQLARIAGIHSEIMKLAELRNEWERDVQWHRNQGGSAREELAEAELMLANCIAETERSQQDLANLHTLEEQTQARIELAETANLANEHRTLELNRSLEVLQDELETAQRVLDEVRTEADEQRLKIQSADDKFKEILQQSATAEAMKTTLLQTHEEYCKRIEDLTQEIDFLEDEINSSRREIEELTFQRDELREAASKEAAVLQANQAESQVLTDRLSTLLSEINLAAQRIESQECTLDAAHERLQSMADTALKHRIESAVQSEDMRLHLNRCDQFVAKATQRLEILCNQLNLAETHWHDRSHVLQGLEYEISDRFQIAEALSLQLQMLEHDLIQVTDRRNQCHEEVSKAEESLSALSETFADEMQRRQVNVLELDNQIRIGREQRELLTADLVAVADQVRDLKQELQSSVIAYRQEHSEHDAAIQSLLAAQSREEKHLHTISDALALRNSEFSKSEQSLADRIDQLETLQTQVNQLTMERETKVRLLLELRRDVRELTQEASSALAWQRASIEQIEVEISAKAEQLTSQSQSCKLLTAQIDDLEKRKEGAENVLRETEVLIGEREVALSNLDAKLLVARLEIDKATSEAHASELRRNQLECHLRILDGQLDDMQGEFSVALGAQLDQLAEIEDQVSQAAERLSLKQAEIEQADSQVSRLQLDQLQIHEKVQAIEATIQLQKRALDELAVGIAVKNQELDSLNAQLKHRHLDHDSILMQIQEKRLALHDLVTSTQLTEQEAVSHRNAVAQELRHLNHDLEKRRAESEEIECRFEQIIAKIHTGEARIDAINADIEARTSELKALELLKAELAELDKTILTTRDRLVALELQSAERQRYAESLEVEINSSEYALSKLKLTHETRLTEYRLLTEQSHELEQLIAEKKVTFADLTDDLETQQELLTEHRFAREQVAAEYEEQLLTLRSMKAELQGSIEQLNRQIASYQQEITFLERSHIEKQELVGQTHMKLELNNQALELLAKEIEAKQRDLAALEQTLSQKHNAAEQAEQRHKQLDSDYAAKEKQLQLLEKQSHALESERLQFESQLGDLRDQVQELRNECSEKQSTLKRQSELTAQADVEISAQQQKLEDLKREVYEADELSRQWKSYVAEVQQEKSIAEDERKRIAEELNQLRLAVTERQASIESGQTLLKELSDEKAKLQDECGRLRSMLEDQHAEVAQVTASIESLRSAEEALNVSIAAKSQQSSLRVMAPMQSDEAEMTIGRLEGLMQELDRSPAASTPPKSPVPEAQPVPPVILDKPRESTNSDPWDNVLS